MKERPTHSTELKPDQREKDPKKEMKDNGVFLVSAFMVMVVVWLVRRFLYGKK